MRDEVTGVGWIRNSSCADRRGLDDVEMLSVKMVACARARVERGNKEFATEKNDVGGGRWGVLLRGIAEGVWSGAGVESSVDDIRVGGPGERESETVEQVENKTSCSQGQNQVGSVVDVVARYAI